MSNIDIVARPNIEIILITRVFFGQVSLHFNGLENIRIIPENIVASRPACIFIIYL